MITQEKNIEIKRIPVRVKNIRKQFQEVEALKNVSIEIPAGKFFTFLGPSGCGKTTLLRIISGFETSTSGDIFIGDKNVNQVPPWSRDIGFVFQNYALWPHMSIYENISYGLKLRKMSTDEIKYRVQEGLQRVGLEGMGDRFPGQLSGGQQQRVAIARGLVLEPQILLLDEPLSNLDAKLRIEMRTELRRLQRDIGITTLYVTHDQEEALEISDSIAVMSNGKVEQIGTPIDIYERPASRFVANFIGAVSIIDGRGGDNGEFILPDGKIFNIGLESVYRNKSVSIAVRPEDVEIASGKDRTVDATVVSSSYLGNKRISVFEIAKGVRIKAEHRTAIEADSKSIGLSIRKYNVFE